MIGMSIRKTIEQMSMKNAVSFHMPGHKNGRLLFQRGVTNLLQYDTTEIPGLDYLHDAHGALRELEAKLSNYYGSYDSKLLVGGSTSGILAAILGATKAGDKIVINRNAHMAVYNSVVLNHLKPRYVMPDVSNQDNIPTGIDLSEFDRISRQEKNISAVVLTYPTYEGICYDLKKVIHKVRQLWGKVPVIVDEAHGAHLRLFDQIEQEDLPASALSLGADIVIQSFHKTLPALNSAAVLHYANKNESLAHAVNWHLRALQTSSPSYLTMASVEDMMDILTTDGNDLIHSLWYELTDLRAFLIEKNLLISPPCERFDPTKLLLAIDQKTQERCRIEDDIYFEWQLPSYALMMTSIANTSEDFQRLRTALAKATPSVPFDGTYVNSLPEVVEEIGNTLFKEGKFIPVVEAVGAVVAEFVIPYPPGIPLLVPGERIAQDHIKIMKTMKKEEVRIL